jgi:hypothetical protein
MFVVKPNQNPALPPTRNFVPYPERHEVYASIVTDLMTNSMARQQILYEQEFPCSFFNLSSPGVSYSIEKEQFEDLLEVFESALTEQGQAIPDDLRDVYRMLKQAVDRLNEDCPVYKSHCVVMLC